MLAVAGMIAYVRSGNLTVVERQPEPRVFSGAVWSNSSSTIVRLPSQGPAPLSTWGFSLSVPFRNPGVTKGLNGPHGTQTQRTMTGAQGASGGWQASLSRNEA
jgi:hypothetical protein